jgi:flagellar M-ring protein FliF
MPPQLTAAGKRVQGAFTSFTAGQKAVTALALVALLAGGVAFVQWASRPMMAPLFTDLAASDAAAVTEELASRGVPYELADGGSTVLVPRADVYQNRIDLSAAGLPSSSKAGYALLDSQGITTSEFRQRVDYQRALEGELATTISSIQDVEAATVHLVLPEEELFADDARRPTASVLVKSRPGQQLSSTQVQAVVHLVASSVEGLEPDAVTVADDQGRVLSTPGEDGAVTGAGDARLTQTRAYEDSLSTEVQEMLTSVVGPGRAVVRVSADLDFDRRETRTERFDQGEGAPRTSETTNTETYTGTGQPVGGVLGPENVPQADGGDSEYAKESSTTNYAVGKVTETSIAAPGAVNRLNVAVLVDSRAPNLGRPGVLEQLVSTAAGLDPARGDVVTVTQMPFDESAAEAAQEALAAQREAEDRAAMVSLARTAAVLVVVVGLVLLAVRSLRKDRRTALPVPVVEVGQPHALPAGPDELPALVGAGAPLAVEAGADSEEARRLQVREEIGALVERQPDEVAQLLRGWLADRRQ